MKVITKKHLLQVIASGIGAVIFLFLLFRFVDLQDALFSLERLTMGKVLLFIPLSFVGMAIATTRWYIVLQSMRKKVPLPFWRLYLIFLAGFPIGYVFSSLGITSHLGRGYLAEKAGLPRQLYVSSLSLEYAIRGFMNIIFITSGFLILLFVGFSMVGKYIGLTVALFILLLIGAFVLWQYTPKKLRTYRNTISKAFKKNPRHVIAAALMMPLEYLWKMTLILIAASFLGINLGFFGVLLYAVLGGVLLNIPSPLTLGTNEATGALALAALGFSAATGVALALVYRLADMFTAIFGSMVLILLLLFQRKKKLQ